MIKIIEIFAIGVLISGCGVKGDPSPPGVPAEIGRGRPTYKRAMQKIKLKTDVNHEDDEDNSSEENSDEEE